MTTMAIVNGRPAYFHTTKQEDADEFNAKIQTLVKEKEEKELKDLKPEYQRKGRGDEEDDE